MRVGEEIRIRVEIDVPTNIRGVQWKIHYDPEFIAPTDTDPDTEGYQIKVSQEDCDIFSSQTLTPNVKFLNDGELGCDFNIAPGASVITEREEPYKIFRFWLKAIKAGATEIKYSAFLMVDENNELVPTEEEGGTAMEIFAMRKGRLILIIESE